MDEFYDIFGMWHVPWWQRQWVKNIGWACVTILVVSCIVYIIKKMLNLKKSIPAWQVAMKDLATLGRPDMLNEHTSKIFYTQLTIIVKQYIHRRYGFDIYGKTDREILAFLNEQVLFPRDLMPVLYDIFEHASLIKFAHATGIVEQMERDLALSMRLIKETMLSQS